MDTNTASTAHDDDYIDDDGLERNKDKDKDKEKGIAATSSSRKRRTARDTSKEPLPGILQEALRATGPVLVVQQRSPNFLMERGV